MLKANREKHLEERIPNRKRITYNNNGTLYNGSREFLLKSILCVIQRGRVITGIEHATKEYHSSFAYITPTLSDANFLTESFRKYKGFSELKFGIRKRLLFHPDIDFSIGRHDFYDNLYTLYMVNSDNYIVDSLEITSKEYKGFLKAARRNNVCVYSDNKDKLFIKYYSEIIKNNPERYLLGELKRIG